jgi:hypothetical protein
LGRKFKSDTQIHGLKLICGQSRWKIREASDGDRGEATTNGATVTSSTFKRSTVGSLKSDLGSFKRGGSGIKRPECGNEQARAQPDRAILARHGATVIIQQFKSTSRLPAFRQLGFSTLLRLEFCPWSSAQALPQFRHGREQAINYVQVKVKISKFPSRSPVIVLLVESSSRL